MTDLLDSSVLVALVIDDHVHHSAARAWVARSADRVATCPITQGALVRILVRNGVPGADTQRVLEVVCSSPRHEFWPDDLDYRGVPLHGVVGHRQVTDTYLAAMARKRSCALVTLDRGLAEMHSDVAVLISV